VQQVCCDAVLLISDVYLPWSGPFTRGALVSLSVSVSMDPLMVLHTICPFSCKDRDVSYATSGSMASH